MVQYTVLDLLRKSSQRCLDVQKMTVKSHVVSGASITASLLTRVGTLSSVHFTDATFTFSIHIYGQDETQRHAQRRIRLVRVNTSTPIPKLTYLKPSQFAQDASRQHATPTSRPRLPHQQHHLPARSLSGRPGSSTRINH